MLLQTLAHGQVGVWDEVAIITLAVLTAALIGVLAVTGKRWFAAEREGDDQPPAGAP
jgi:hypothetical protein